MIKKLSEKEIDVATLIIGIFALLMMLLPVLVLRDSETAFNGLEVAFGTEFINLGPWASGEIAINPMVMLAFLLPLIAGLIPMFTTKGTLISTILFLGAAILIFMTPQLTTVTVTVIGNATEIDVDWTFGLGLILAAAAALLGASLGAARIYKHL
ncbi:MAG: hypothetical protein ACNA7K_06370 [Acholeplasmataceae bacterium]